MSGQVKEVSVQYQVSRDSCDSVDSVESRACPQGYKQTEVGVIPEDWLVEPLENFTSFISYGFTNPMPTSIAGPFMVTAKDINSGRILYESARQTTEEAYKTLLSPKSKPKLKDILLTKDGTLGRLALVEKEGICINQSVALLRPNERVDPKYFKKLLESPTYQKKMIEDAGGSTIKHIYITIVNRMLVNVPESKEEQTAIANALSDVDALITSLEKLIAKKRAIKAAAMQQLLTGKKRLPPFDLTHIGYKQTELGEIPEDWEVVSLGDIAKFYKGRGLPKSDLVVGGLKECIHYGELFTQYRELIDTVISRTNADYDAFVSAKNDVLMPTSDVTPNGLATASSIKKEGVILGGDILIIRPDKDILDSSFFANLISISKDKIMQLVSGSTVYHLYGSDMATFRFALPSDVEEQVAIADLLIDMTHELSALEQRLNKTQQLKQGMMQELLTGRTRLI